MWKANIIQTVTDNNHLCEKRMTEVAEKVLDDVEDRDLTLADLALATIRRLHPTYSVGQQTWRVYDQDTCAWFSLPIDTRGALCKLIAAQASDRSRADVMWMALDQKFVPALRELGEKSPFREYRAHINYGLRNAAVVESEEVIQRYLSYVFYIGPNLRFTGRHPRRFEKCMQRLFDVRLAFGQLRSCLWASYITERIAWEQDGGGMETEVGKLVVALRDLMWNPDDIVTLSATRAWLKAIATSRPTLKCAVSFDVGPLWDHEWWLGNRDAFFHGFHGPPMVELDSPLHLTSRDLLKLKVLRILYERFRKTIDNMPHVVGGVRWRMTKEVMEELREFERNLDKLDVSIEHFAAKKIQAATAAWRVHPEFIYKIAKRSWDARLQG